MNIRKWIDLVLLDWLSLRTQLPLDKSNFAWENFALKLTIHRRYYEQKAGRFW
jgi:hypothetical protein